MNIILRHSKRMPVHTDLKPIFTSFNGLQNEFHWLLTDLMLNYYPANFLSFSRDAKIFTCLEDSQNSFLFDGESLTKLIFSHDIQFIWGVLSALPKDVEIDLKQLAVTPYAQDNPTFWSSNPQIQHPLAVAEIVCWDSSLTLFLSKHQVLEKRFRTYFPEAIDLHEYNRR